MPVLRNRLVLRIARGLKGFVNFEAGLTRGNVPDVEHLEAEVRQLGQVRKRLTEQDRQLSTLKAQLAQRDKTIEQLNRRFENYNKSLSRLTAGQPDKPHAGKGVRQISPEPENPKVQRNSSDHVPTEKEIFGDPTRERIREWILSHGVEHLHGPEEVPYEPDELIVTCMVRNGELYIRDFIEHHLSLGIKHIVFLDNGSEDGTVTIAREYENVTVLRSLLPFKRYKQAARRYLIKRFGMGRWCLYADVDELFDYPFSDVVNLDSLLRYLNENSYTAVVAYMLDMFSDKPISYSAESELGSLKETHRYYDLSEVQASDYRDARGSRNIVSNEEIRFLRGGIQLKIFGHRPVLTKHPLIFVNEKLEFSHVFPHWVYGVHVADFTGVLYHYKFVDHFRERALRAVREGGYAHNSAKYQKFLRTLDKTPDLHPRQDSAQQLRSVDDLVDDQFLTVSEEYMMLVDEQEAKIRGKARQNGPSKLVRALSTARARTRTLDLTVERLEQRVRNLNYELSEEHQRIEALQTTNHEILIQLEKTKKQLSKKKEQIYQITSSRSWRLLQTLHRINIQFSEHR